jgi:hypothetical protein
VAAENGVKLGRIAVLFLLVAALGAYLYWVEVPKARQEATKAKLLDATADAITSVDLVFPDREIVLSKRDGTWHLTKPLEAPADEGAVKALLGSLTGAEVQKTLDETPTDLASFGLDKPDSTVRLATAAGDLPPIAVGKNAAIGGKTYVRVGDGKISLTPATLKVALNKQPKDLRDKQLLAFKDEDVTRVDVTPADGKPVSIVKKDKDAWTIEPGDQVADLTEVRSYLSALRSTRAIDFPETDVTAAGLDKPRLAVTIGFDKGAAPQTLLVGNDTTQGTQKQVFAKRGDQPTIVTLGDWSFRTLGKDAWQFRDKTVLGFGPDRVGRIVVERKEGTGATLAHGEPGGWKVERPEASKEPSKAGAIQRFVDDLRDLRGSGIAAEPAKDLKRFGLDAPDLRVTLSDREGKPLGAVLLAKHDGKYYGVREGGPTVFEIRDYMYTRLDKQQRDFVGPEEPPPTAPTPGGQPESEPDEDEPE